MDKYNIRDAIKDGTPIIMGFIPIAMAFGILSESAGITLIESLGFSMIVTYLPRFIPFLLMDNRKFLKMEKNF